MCSNAVTKLPDSNMSPSTKVHMQGNTSIKLLTDLSNGL